MYKRLFVGVFVSQLLFFFTSSYAIKKIVTPEGYEVFITEESDVLTVTPLESLEKNLKTTGVSNFKTYSQSVISLKSDCLPAETSGVPKHTPDGVVSIPLGDDFFVIPFKEKLSNLPSWLPPHPGEKGEETIHGIDIDRDCVRDDIEHLIVKKFPKADQVQIRKYLFEYAIWLNEFLKPEITEVTARGISNELAKSGLCVKQLVGGGQSSLALKDMFAEFHNTYPRSYRYIDNIGVISGWTTREDLLFSCL